MVIFETARNNILGNPRGYACKIELEFVENLKFLAFSTTKILKNKTNTLLKTSSSFCFFGFVKYRVGRIRASKL